MQYRQLGKSGIEVSAIGLGTWPFSGSDSWGAQDDRESIATVHAALDAGVNLFDTAESYGAGRSEDVLGRALEGRRHQAVIATKVTEHHLRPDDVRAACEASLRRLRTDVIDLYQIHWPNWDVPLADTVGAMEDLRREGKVRALGVSNFGVRDMTEFLSLAPCASNQVPYSLLWRAIEHGIQPTCVAHGVGILPYTPLEQGLLTGRFATADDVPEGRMRTRFFSGARPMVDHGEPGHEEAVFRAIGRIREIAAGAGIPMADLALAWLLHRPAVASVPVGARRPDQIVKNAEAASLQLSDDVLVALEAATTPLKEEIGTNPDHYQAVSRLR